MAKESTAPDPQNFEVVKDEGAPKADKVTVSETPTITLYGCGGFGANTVQRMKNGLPKGVHVRKIDTSKSNLQEGEKATDIINGNGSGKVRATNLKEISKFISTKVFEEENPSDINIVAFSLSGGTGSVAGPLLIKEIKRRGGTAIAVVVADMVSELDTDNTFKTFQTLESICNSGSIYLPIMLFDNSAKRSIVDTTVSHRLRLLLRYLTMDTLEMDRSDKINFFRPDHAVGAAPGVKGCHVSFGPKGDYKEDSGEIVVMPDDFIYDAVTMVTPSADAKANTDTRILYHGIMRNPENNGDKIIGYMGFPISEIFVGKINDSLSKYAQQASQTHSLGFQPAKEVKQDGDIIL